MTVEIGMTNGELRTLLAKHISEVAAKQGLITTAPITTQDVNIHALGVRVTVETIA